MQESQMAPDIGRFAIVPEWLIFSGVSPQAIRLFALLACRYADKNGVAFPSQRTLAKDLGISPLSVRRAIKELKSVRAITVEGRHTSSGDRDTNMYKLHFAKPGGFSDDGTFIGDCTYTDERTYKNERTVRDEQRGGFKFDPQTIPNGNQKNNNPPLHPPTGAPGRADERGPSQRRQREEYPPDFERFWSVYPRKVEKRRAFKCWQTRLREGYTADELIRAAEAYAQECRRKGRSQDYIKHASTFLGPSKPFEDYLARASPDTDTGGGLIDWIPEVPFEGEGIGA